MSTPQETSVQKPETEVKPTETAPETVAKPAEKPAEDPRVAALEAELKEAKTKAERYAIWEEMEALREKGDVVELNKRLLKDKFGPDILLTLGAALADEDDSKLSVEDRVKRALEAEKKAKEDVEARAKEEAAKKAQEDEDREYNAYMEKSAKFLTENAAKFPLCDKLGVDAEDYGKRLYDFIAKEKRIPEPEELYAALEAEKEAKLEGTKYAPPKAEANGISFKVPEPVVPRGQVVFQAPEDLDPIEEQRRALRAYDQQKANERTLRARA